MHRSPRGPLGLLLAVLALAATALLPSAASATVVTSGSLELLPRASWITYVTRFGGTTRALAPATLDTTTNVLTAPFGGLTTTTYETYLDEPGGEPIVEGSGRASFGGGIEYTVSAHFISVKLSDLAFETTSVADTAARVWALADYDPLESPPVAGLTGYVWTHIANADLSAARFTSALTPLVRHQWQDAPLTLTAAGATVFNGGANGSYRAGSPFGSINAWVAH